MQQETVIVLDFGGQYNQLIARRVRECNVYCEIYSYRTDLAKIKAKNPKGIIFTGGPNSAYLVCLHLLLPLKLENLSPAGSFCCWPWYCPLCFTMWAAAFCTGCKNICPSGFAF